MLLVSAMKSQLSILLILGFCVASVAGLNSLEPLLWDQSAGQRELAYLQTKIHASRIRIKVAREGNARGEAYMKRVEDTYGVSVREPARGE
jgi:hypothetical protein